MKGERGSVMPLGIAITAFSLLASMFFVELIGIQYQTLQNKQLADVLALNVSGQLMNDKVPPVPNLNYSPMLTPLIQEASIRLAIYPSQVFVSSNDGKTIQAQVCTPWRSVTGITFGGIGSVCAESKARAIPVDV